MVKRVTSNPRRGGYHRLVKPKEVGDDGDNHRFLPVVSKRDQETFAESEVNHYISRQAYGGRVRQPDYREE